MSLNKQIKNVKIPTCGFQGVRICTFSWQMAAGRSHFQESVCLKHQSTCACECDAWAGWHAHGYIMARRSVPTVAHLIYVCFLFCFSLSCMADALVMIGNSHVINIYMWFSIRLWKLWKFYFLTLRITCGVALQFAPTELHLSYKSMRWTSYLPKITVCMVWVKLAEKHFRWRLQFG